MEDDTQVEKKKLVFNWLVLVIPPGRNRPSRTVPIFLQNLAQFLPLSKVKC